MKKAQVWQSHTLNPETETHFPTYTLTGSRSHVQHSVGKFRGKKSTRILKITSKRSLILCTILENRLFSLLLNLSNFHKILNDVHLKMQTAKTQVK